jgi:hypothetical protein
MSPKKLHDTPEADSTWTPVHDRVGVCCPLISVHPSSRTSFLYIQESILMMQLCTAYASDPTLSMEALPALLKYLLIPSHPPPPAKPYAESW